MKRRSQRGGGASCWPDQCCALGPEAPPSPGSWGRCDAAALREAESSQNSLNHHVLMEEQADVSPDLFDELIECCARCSARLRAVNDGLLSASRTDAPVTHLTGKSSFL